MPLSQACCTRALGPHDYGLYAYVIAWTAVLAIPASLGLPQYLVREYPQAEGDPYYPVPRAENEALFKRYEALAEKEPGVTFVGQVAQYCYYNMD